MASCYQACRVSCYQACETAAKPTKARVSAPSNFSNLKALTGSKSAPFRWTTAKRRHTQPRKHGFPTRRAVP